MGLLASDAHYNPSDAKKVHNDPPLLSFPQDALASFDFLNKRNSVAVKPDLDRSAEQDLQHPDLELITIQKDKEIRWERPVTLCLMEQEQTTQI